MLTRWRVPEGGELVLLETVQGLVPERDRVRAAFNDVHPAALGVGVSPEAAASLLRYERAEDEDPFEDLPEHDLAYRARLAAFGDVSLPPPDLLETARLAKANDIPLYGVDLTDERYEELWTSNVTTWQFLQYGRVQRRLARRPPKGETARELALAWDARVRRVKGIEVVERAREAQLAEGAARLAAEADGPVLVVVDVARADGVKARLADAGARTGNK